MMLCSRCKKRPAVVFITAMQGDKKKNDGLCLVCAKEMHVPQIDEYMKQMGISDEELEQISNQMMDMMDGDTYVVADNNIMVCISKLRAKLDEDPAAYIRTIRGLGYRLEK